MLLYDKNERQRAEKLYQKYVGFMAYIARENLADKSLVDDVVSEAAIKMMRHVDTIEKFACYQQRQYIVYIVKSVCIDRYRKEGNQNTESFEVLDGSLK